MRRFLLPFFIVCLLGLSCTEPLDPVTPVTPVVPPDPPAPDPGGNVQMEDISRLDVSESFEIPFAGSLVLPYKGINVGDKIELELRSDKNVRYSLTCTSTDKNGASFTVPSKFVGGMCKLTFNTASRKTSCETFVAVRDTMQLEKVPGMTSYGRVIDYEGKPISGVVVSDGVRTCTTDNNGCYYMASMRKYGYVFISVPSGYMPAVNRSVPQFFSRFKSNKSSDYEIHSFVLEPIKNNSHRAIVFTDTHLARRTDDLSQFENYFKKDLKEQITKAQSENKQLFALALGDLAWDEWWYNNNFSLAEYYETMSDLDIPVFSIPGNHDNDPYVADDFLSENAFRINIGPTYYSFNAGNIHYVMMDDTIFNNKGASQGTIGNVQDYTQGFTNDALKWLRADLDAVPAGSTIVFGNHIQYTSRPAQASDGTFAFNYAMPAEFREELQDLFASYNVHIVSGHTHVNYTNRIADNILEHNTCGVCGTWWWTGYYSKNKCRINGDGSPSGYRVFEGSDNGEIKWKYKAVARSEDYQFRAYDLNNCRITRSVYCPNAKTSKVSDDFFNQYANGYEQSRADNKVLVNVFDWDDNWTITASENGKELSVKRVDAYDPLHVVHFNMARMNTNSTAMTFPTNKTSHMFEISCSSATSNVVITVRDSFGNEYSESMKRPRNLYDMSTEDKW